MISSFKNGLLQGLGIITILGVFGISYAAVTSVSSGSQLTADLFNQQMVPSGAVMAFNLVDCPDGWSKANGIENALDLRGEFIRGWDDGRGVDGSRGLASWQEGTQPFSSISGNHPYFAGDGPDSQNYDMGTLSATYTKYTNATAKSNMGTETKIRRVVRPRNVALLYCVKN